MIIKVETEDEAKELKSLFEFLRTFTLVLERRGRNPNYLMYTFGGMEVSEPFRAGDVRRIEEWFPELLAPDGVIIEVKS